MKMLKKIFLGLLFFIAALAISFLIYLNFGINDASHKVNVAIRKLEINNLICNFTGKPCEIEMLAQAKLIKELSLTERLVFYREISIRFELNNYLANIFDEEMIGDDGKDFYEYLTVYIKTPAFKRLSKSGRENIEYWISTLPISDSMLKNQGNLEQRKVN